MITRRSHNLNVDVIERLNHVIRGTADYFATPRSRCGNMYRSLGRRIRMQLRCMKFKRKPKVDTTRAPFEALQEYGTTRPEQPAALRRNVIASVPLRGAISAGPPDARDPHAGKYEELTSSR